ncbi:MAG: outer membrane beta-barrel protein [Bacteroidota bacterium]
MKFTLIVSCTLIFLCTFVELDAQRKRFRPKQRFHAGIIAGMNLAQIDGDNHTGYNKIGIMGGLQGIALVSRRVHLVAELLYAEKGARVEYLDAAVSRKERVLDLRYAEAPILVRIHLTSNEDKDQATQVAIETGFSFAGLLQTNIEENVDRVTHSFTAVADEFKRNEINYIIGLQIAPIKQLRLGIRSTTAISRMYVNEMIGPSRSGPAPVGFQPPLEFFRNYHLGLYVSYQIY